MKIGLTYDLRQLYLEQGYSEEQTAEFESQETVRALLSTLQELGYSATAVGHLRALADRLLQGERWDLVFNVAEGLGGFGRESQVPCLLESFRIPYTFSDPLVLSLTLHKGMTKRVLRDLGLPTPDFAVIESEADLRELDLRYPLFAKPVAEGTSKGITAASRVSCAEELQRICLELLDKFEQPVLVEEFLPGREFTVGITGTGRQAQILGVMEILLEAQAEPMAYSYGNKAHYEDLVRYRLVRDKTARRAGEIALAAWRGMGCRDGGRIDLRCDANGRVNLIEINPLPGLDPIRSDLCILSRMAGITYPELIQGIVASALERQQTGSRRVSARVEPEPATAV
jgi:D-alanine-D-alanine ligase